MHVILFRYLLEIAGHPTSGPLLRAVHFIGPNLRHVKSAADRPVSDHQDRIGKK